MVSMHFQCVTQCPVMPFQYPHCPAFSLLHPVFKTSEPRVAASTGSFEAFQSSFHKCDNTFSSREVDRCLNMSGTLNQGVSVKLGSYYSTTDSTSCTASTIKVFLFAVLSLDCCSYKRPATQWEARVAHVHLIEICCVSGRGCFSTFKL